MYSVAAIMTTFKTLAEEIKMKCRVCKIFRQHIKAFTELQILGIIGRDEPIRPNEEENELHTMNFDCCFLKNRQDRFPRRAELVTSKRPKWRTEGEAMYLRSLLQTLPSYRRYSSHIQMLLAKVFRFERFERRRVIIKKGHLGSSFYFIFSGCVAVCNDEDGSSAFVDTEPVLLHKGAKFGEIALLEGQRRNATVVCMLETELLVIDKKDFFANKLDEELKNELQYRIDYFRSLDIISHWPPEHIKSISENCQTREFDYNRLIMQDTSKSNSIAFITEGVCEVFRFVDLSNCPSYYKWLNVSMPIEQTPLLQEALYNTMKPLHLKNCIMTRIQQFICGLTHFMKETSCDDNLSKLFLQQNDWSMFKKDLVNLLVKPLTTHQAETKQITKCFQFPAGSSQTGILDLCSTALKKQQSATATPRGKNVSTQERRDNPLKRNVKLVHGVAAPRPRLDRILY
ncbi:cyclic nucleotide-binding domain-containing protein 2-like isoform X5 [Hyperolius riggenbachi]|uniref:cyclic nucleotide-binding domain-containing protein 2-like isoform X5 n=1 Tax=Hyperolius riggenbachi TaxID=752182 RepID=UPI0035A3C935